MRHGVETVEFRKLDDLSDIYFSLYLEKSICSVAFAARSIAARFETHSASCPLELHRARRFLETSQRKPSLEYIPPNRGPSKGQVSFPWPPPSQPTQSDTSEKRPIYS